MPRFRSPTAAVLGILPALTLGTPPAHPAAGPVSHAIPVWQLADSRHFGQPGNASGFSTVVIAGRQVWVLGGTNPGGPSAPVALSRTGQRWRLASLQTGLTDFISDATASSASDIWAISSYGRYVLHWNGISWQVVRRWRQQGVLSDVAAVSSHNAWVFGTSATGDRTIGTWQYDGQRWIAVRGIASEIYRASAVSGRDIWAIAAGQNSDTILHLAGQRWHQVPAGRALAGIRWHDIQAESATDVWLVGNLANLHGIGPLVLAHWNGKRWTKFTSHVHAWAGQLAAAGRGQAMVTASSTGILATGLIFSVSADGRMTWSSIASSFGTGVSDVAVDPKTGRIWATGGILTQLGGNAAIWTRSVRPASRRHRSSRH
jgi:hypothetical protein